MRQEIEFSSKKPNAKEESPTGAATSNVAPCPDAVLVKEGKSRERLAFFIHGTPGAASDWDAVVQDLLGRGCDCEMVSLDRPGFGANLTRCTDGQMSGQLDCFEAILASALKSEKKLLLVGHSYGAALALGLADRLAGSGNFLGLVLVSGVLSPKVKQYRWYHKLLLLPVIASIAPQRYVLAAKEMSSVRATLEELEDFWCQIDFPVTLIHGDEDRLIPLENSRFAFEQLDSDLSRLVVVPQGEHALPQTHPKLIADELERILVRSVEEVDDER